MKTNYTFQDILNENENLRREIIRIKKTLYDTWLKSHENDEQELIDEQWAIFSKKNELEKNI